MGNNSTPISTVPFTPQTCRGYAVFGEPKSFGAGGDQQLIGVDRNKLPSHITVSGIPNYVPLRRGMCRIYMIKSRQDSGRADG